MPEPVVIVAYDPAWPERFATLGGALREALGQVAVRIDHIGSTAVPGLAAKPVLDVQISVAAFDPLAAYAGPLAALGFAHRADNPDRTKRYFREAPGSPRTHIHVRRAGSWTEQQALLFRDYMRAHEYEARAYAELKRRLATLHRLDRHAYTEAKGDFIWAVLRRADAWSQATGWLPGPSDA